MKARHLASTLLAGASCFVITQFAFAQAQPEPGAAQSGVRNTETVIVTGSRVITNGNASPTPVTVVGVQDMQAVQPATVSDNLNNLPVFAGSRNQFGNPLPSGGNGAANELNLRNLGSNRNLVLFDGHRLPPTLTGGDIDTDMVPQMLLQRVDVVTGGVSAVYGSDAISGVINFITDKNFNGVKGHAQAGISGYGDDQTYNVGVAGGTGLFDGRGHVEGSYEYRKDRGLLHRSDRPWNDQIAAEGSGTAANPYQLLHTVRLANASFGGLITSGVLAGQAFKTNGVLSPFVHGTPSGTSCCEVGGDGAYYDTSLKAPLETHQFFGRFDYDFSDTLHGNISVAGDLKRNEQFIDPIYLNGVTLSAKNAFLAPAYQATLAAAKQTTFKLGEFMLQNLPRENPVTYARQFFVNGNLNGDIGAYHWDFAYIHGWTTQSLSDNNNYNNDKLSAALDAVADPASGQAVCSVTLTNPGLYPGCVPLNVFGPTSVGPSAANYVLSNSHSVGKTTTNDLEASIAGSLFSIWAGPVTTALSAEWRDISFSQTSDAMPTDLMDCTGLRFNCQTGSALWFRSSSTRSEVSQSVLEGAFEFDAPLLKDLPLVEALNLNGAVRYTSYDTSGSYWTWKVGLDWQVDDAFRIRATESQDIRAPTLNDLFAPVSVGTQTSLDLLTGLTPTVPIYGGGNPNLTAEIGHTSTGGIVWQPAWAPGLSASTDVYFIKITNAISGQIGTNFTIQNACYASGGKSPYCQLQARPSGFTNTSPANAVTAWYNRVINISQAETYGSDFEVNYKADLFGRPLSLRGLATFQPHLIFATPGLTTLDDAGVAYTSNALYPLAKLRLTGIVHYNVTDDFSVDLLERWRSAMSMRDDPSQVWINPDVAAVAYTNLNLAYRIDLDSLNYQLFLNIQNLFDLKPPPAAFHAIGARPGQYGGWAIGDDPIGRYFTFGVRISE